MSVVIYWSLTNGGAAISAAVDHGNSANGNTTTATEIFVRHDGSNSITGCGLYIREYSSTYSGTFTSATDIAELIAWADASTVTAFGGFQINLNAEAAVAGVYPVASWPTYNSKSPSGGYAFRTGVGDSEGNAITIPTTTGATASGEIQAGASPNVRFQVRVQVPTDEDTIGIRQWDQILVYSFTS